MVLAQEPTTDSAKKNLNTLYVIQRFDGTVIIGKIKYQDPTMVIMDVKKLGEVVIRKNDIEIMRELYKQDEQALIDFTPAPILSAKYMFTPSMIPITKGDNFLQWNLFGPEMHMAVLNNFEVTFLSSWLVVPIGGTIKYTASLNDYFHIGFGGFGAWGSWVFPRYGGFMPYGAMSLGDFKNNATVSGGYGGIFIDGVFRQKGLISFAGSARLGKRGHLIIESFVLPSSGNGDQAIAIFIPGIRLQSLANSAFQLGFATLFLDWTMLPTPIPVIQWFKKF